MTEFFEPPQTQVSFGDIFEADFFFDAYLRADAVQMGSQQLSERRGGGVAYSSAWAGNRKYVLARGAPHRAALITDNCLVDTALAQGRKGGRPKNRLLFAPITEASHEDGEIFSYGRFAMPAWNGRLPAGVIELRRCFMVDSRDVAAHIDDRIASLAPHAADDLEVRWNAFSARRGPLPSLRNAEKLAELLSHADGRVEVNEDDTRLGVAVADALAAAWRVEGRDLVAVADVYERIGMGDAPSSEAAGEIKELERPGEAETEQLERALRELADKAQCAAEELARVRASS